MTKIRSKKILALVALGTLLVEACGGRVQESSGAAGADSQGAGVGGAIQVAKGGAGGSSAEPVAGAAGLCSQTPCECVVGSQEPCNQHYEDGVGTCKAGTRECVRLAGQRAAYGDCHDDVGPMSEGCGPQMPDANCNGIPGDGDYRVQPGCAISFNAGGTFVNLFVAPHPGTVPVHLCTSRCRSYSYLAPNCDGNSISSDQIQGYAAATAVLNYVRIDIPASSCSQSATYGNASFDVQAPAFTFYALP